MTQKKQLDVATFAGGCFWCMVQPFDSLPGIEEVISGYSGGSEQNPTYEEVVAGETGHREVVQIHFDSSVFPYEKLLDMYWRTVDPTDAGGQFSDRGEQYKTAIYYHNDDQRKTAEASEQRLADSGTFDQPIVVEILPAQPFYPAEEKHQNYYQKASFHYNLYNKSSGRKGFLEKTWRMEKDDEALRKQLTPEQYAVTQENKTETPYENAYWDNQKEGIYVDAVSGEPLFSTTDQYDADCGWPSFTRPLSYYQIEDRLDESQGVLRTEIRSKYADSHLGHVFFDGPEETGGVRFCINSAAMKFIPKEQLEKEGYGEYLALF